MKLLKEEQETIKCPECGLNAKPWVFKGILYSQCEHCNTTRFIEKVGDLDDPN